MLSLQGGSVRRISAASRPSPVKGTASVAAISSAKLWYKPPSNVDPVTSQCTDDFPGLAVIEHVHDIAVPEGMWCDRNRKVYPVSFGPSDSLLQPVAHGFVGHGP